MKDVIDFPVISVDNVNLKDGKSFSSGHDVVFQV